MGQGLVNLAIPAWQIVVRALVIYLVLLLGLRLFGKRQVGQFTIFDLVLILLVANALQPAMTGPDNSLLGGLIIIATLFAANWLVDWLEVSSPLMREALLGHPTIIAEDGEWFPNAMRREGVDLLEAEAALREHGLETVEEARLVVLEADGTISVVPREADIMRGRRRIHLRHLKR